MAEKKIGTVSERFYVIDSESSETSADRTGAGESFDNEGFATTRAKRLAESEPGVSFFIVKVVAVVKCEVGRPEVFELERK